MTRTLTFALLLTLSWPAGAQTIAGPATITDGDTVRVGEHRIRIWGIDAPERAQTCSGRDGQVYECGRDSAAVLAELTRGKRVKCEPRDRDRYGRTVATCAVEGVADLGAAMVRRGWAVAYTRYSRGRYLPEQEAARAEGLGIWSGRFTAPDVWRRENRR